MSLDVYLALPVDSGNPEITAIDVYNSNITHNLIKMANAVNLYDFLWRPSVSCRASDLISPLAQAISELRNYPNHYDKFNADNGWGTREQFVAWLDELLKNCEKYPNAIFYSTR